MKTLNIKKSTNAVAGRCNLLLAACSTLFFYSVIAPSSASSQAVLFDFNNAPQYTSLPISQTVSGITAHFSATGQGYSIQDANTMGFTPADFGGLCIYPNSIYLADLLVGFDQTLTDFSIMYACQELGCDDAATMRVTAYMSGNFVGTSTKTASVPGTWPTDTLSCSFTQGFDSVVVHYDSPPPTCQDYGVIYMADNMRVTASPTGIVNPQTVIEGLNLPNPFLQSSIISFSLLQSSHINITVYDITGRLVKNLFDGTLNTGVHQLNWNVNDGGVKGGVYFLNVAGENFSRSYKLIVVK